MNISAIESPIKYIPATGVVTIAVRGANTYFGEPFSKSSPFSQAQVVGFTTIFFVVWAVFVNAVLYVVLELKAPSYVTF